MSDKKYKIINIIIAVLVVIIFGIIIFVQSGVCAQTPKVTVTPDNCYDDTLVVITDRDYSPYSFYDEDGNVSGHDIEVVTMIANDLKMNLDLKMMSWNDGIAAITAGEADVLMTCDYSDSFEGVDKLIKSEPVSDDVFIVYSKSKITSSDMLYGKRIAVMKNGNVTTEIKKMNLAKYCVEYADNRQAMQALIDDEVDYAIMRQTVGTVLLEELGKHGIHGYVSVGQSDMCFGINIQEPELADQINNSLEKLKMSGESERLRKKWLTTFIKPYTFTEVIVNNKWIPFAAVILLLTIVGAFVRDSIRKRNAREDQYRNAQLIEQLAQDFECVNYIKITDNPEKDIVINYRVSEKIKEYIPGWEEERYFYKKLKMLCDVLVYEPDKTAFFEDTNRKKVIDAVKESDVYYVNVRLNIQDSIEYYQMKFTSVNEKGILKGLVAGLHSVDLQTKKEMAMHEELQNALDIADAASKSKSEFLFNMSHDIRTPMNAIIGFTNMAQKNLDNREKLKECLEKTQQSSNLLLSLINSILDMSRIESGKAIVDEMPGDVRLSFANIKATTTELARAKNIDLSFEIGDVSDAYVYADYERCTRIFINIITNAIKYTKNGGFVKVKCEQIGKKDENTGLYRYTFEDNGIGMSEEFQTKVFDRFSREENSTTRGIQGTGLGLSVVKSFVELMNGTVECESKQGVGTTFTVTLPLKLQTDESNLEYQNPDNGKKMIFNPITENSKEVNFKGRKVLLVEDNDFNREIATDILEEEGLEVDTAEDGSIAVNIIQEKGFEYYDFILMDIQMPIMGGYEATETIKRLYPDIKTPIIALSANAFTEDREASRAAGMDDHIAKPIKIKELFGVLSRFI